MHAPSREFATSSNGDRWSLEINEASGAPHVIHPANLPFGGALTRVEVGEFLCRQDSPERQALLALIGTLVRHDQAKEARSKLRPRWTE
jgi:hypothetical protein